MMAQRKAAVAGSVIALAMVMGVPAAAAGGPSKRAKAQVCDHVPDQALDHLPAFFGCEDIKEN